MNKDKKQKILWSIALAFVLFLIIMYVSGWRITSEVGIGKTGTLVINTPYIGTDVYINDDQKITTIVENESIEKKVSPKTHKIIVALKEFYPWTKDIVMPSKGLVTLNPMFVPQNPSGYIIGETDKDYRAIKKSILENKLPDENTPKVHKTEDVKIFVKDNTIFAVKNGETLEVLKSEVKIKNLDFYKNRTDVVMFSAGGAIYAIEVSKVGTQNFMPIYKGKDPFFVVETEKTIYIDDNQMLMQVAI
ncbi:MAG: hypothetical protein V4690_00640 [Patescibacteria group bacterium]